MNTVINNYNTIIMSSPPNQEEEEAHRHRYLPPTLQSYEPDLEVIVGMEGNSKIYKYHGAILAHQSAYVDALLSTPMVEQETRSLSFPDVTPDEWERWLYHLEPRGAHEVLAPHGDSILSEDMYAALAFYEKYQFVSGLELCDYKISSLIKLTLKSKHSYDFYRYGGFYEDVVKLAKVLRADEYDLPLTKAKDALPEFIASGLSFFYHKVSEEDLKMLLSQMYEADEKSLSKTLLPLVDIACGATYEERSLEDMMSKAYEDSFVSKLKTKREQNRCHQAILDRLRVQYMRVEIHNAPWPVSLVVGNYEISERFGPIDTADLGAMGRFYGMNIIENDVSKSIVIQPMDGLGSAWAISKQDGDYSTRCKGGNATCLFKWDGKGNNMLCPPNKGWIYVGDENVDSENIGIEIHYSLTS